MNETNEVVYNIKGHPYCNCYCCEDITIPILARDGMTPTGGSIVKKWKGCGSEMLEMDAFSLTFPSDADMKARALVLGALFAVDFLYFEREK